jgi:hypothetical protein
LSRARFNDDKLVSIPVGALAALVALAEDREPEGELLATALNEARCCACAQGVDLETPQAEQAEAA